MLAAAAVAAQTPTKEQEKPFIQDYIKAVVGAPPASHGEIRVQTPEDLQGYDPKLYELMSRVYADHHIPMDVYHGKNIPPPRRRGAQ